MHIKVMSYSKLPAVMMAGIALSIATHAAEESAAHAVRKALPPASTKKGVTFDKDIKSLFEASCVKCHSGQRAKGDLHLDTREGVLKGSEEGPVVKEGDSANSVIVKAIARINPKTMMPPPPRKPRPGAEAAAAKPQPAPPKPLTDEEVGLVRAWIDQGAK
jgi:hypothetical protein